MTTTDLLPDLSQLNMDARSPAGNGGRHPLVAAAVDALAQAAAIHGEERPGRQVRQPRTWLLRRCWQALTQAGHPAPAFTIVDWLKETDPLALYEALPLLAEHATKDPGLAFAVTDKLQHLRTVLLSHALPHEPDTWSEKLLAIASAAARLQDASLAFACLERLDQHPRVWPYVFAHERTRERLVESVGYAGLHPLTGLLIRDAIRRHEDPGADFLQRVARLAARQSQAGRRTSANRRLLRRCVSVFETAAITSLLGRRYAAVAFALEGRTEQILEQVTIIANVQEARREAGIFVERDAEQMLLRQVRRPRANADIDFLVYTMKEAIDALPGPNPVAELSLARRQALADRLADLGARSDGWTAAAAASALVRLGGAQHAAAVVEQVDRRDPSRSEAHRALVEALLDAGDLETAQAQTEKALAWAQSLPERHPERLTIRGIAEAFLAHNLPEQALALLDRKRPPSFAARMRRLLRNLVDEETLREEALRLHAALLLGDTDKAALHLSRIRRWAPKTLEGKALALFMADHVLEPLLASPYERMLWGFLPDLEKALDGIVGRELPARVEEVSLRLVQRLAAQNVDGGPLASDDGPGAAADFLVGLWRRSAQRGLWQTVYAIGGSLPLFMALAGPEAVVELARLWAE